MSEIIGILLLIFLIYFIVHGVKVQGSSFWMDLNKIFVLIWISVLSLYDFKFSSLYNPTIEINIIVIAIAGVFVIASKAKGIEKADVVNLLDGFKDKSKYKKYFQISNVIFALGVAAFLINIAIYGLAIFSKNRIGKQEMNHYSAYLVYMLVLCGQIKYVLAREFKRKSDFIMLIVVLCVLFLTLNRGPLLFIIISVYIYELVRFIYIKSSLSRKKIYLTFGAMALVAFIFLIVFSYVGNMRMSYALKDVLQETLQQHYHMNEHVPKAFVWIYIYSTSPLENVAYSIAHQNVQFTYFNNLLYPFIKFFANIFRQGDAYKSWLSSRTVFTPYLDYKAGLNVSSFIFDAYSDFSYLGICVYVFIYFALAYCGITLIKKKGYFSSLGTIIIYSNIFIMLVLSIFDNSLKVPLPILNIILVLLIEYNDKFGFLSKYIEKIKMIKKK